MRQTLRRLALCLTAALGLVSHPVTAQVTEPSRQETEDALRSPLDEYRNRRDRATATPSVLALEGAVDPDEYIVGPGDVFAILVRGFESSTVPVVVSADGRLPLPDAGSIAVADLTLSVARDSILAALRPVFGRTEVEATLVQPRSFFIHVTGAVARPGRYQAPPASRVSTALELASADTSQSVVPNRALRPGFRNISVVRRDGSELSVDLRRYFSGGSTSHNPYLRDGDVVVVGTFDPSYEAIRVDGSVPFPDSYEARPGDTLLDLLEVAGIRSSHPVESVVRLTREQDDGSVTALTLSLDEVLSGQAGAQPVVARDHISLEPRALPGGTATVDGWVYYPGTYPIREGTTTVRDLMERAGGLRDDALTAGAYVVRRVPRVAISAAGTELPDEGSPDSKRLRLTELSIVGRIHFSLAYQGQNQVPVDIPAMLRGDAEPLVLRDGDRLVIPRDFRSVYVFGQVLRPGFVAFEPGRAVKDYVAAAGGVGPNAGAVMLLRNQNGEMIDDLQAAVQSGDLVFVDRAREVTESFVVHQALSLDRQASAAERQASIAADQNRRNSKYQFVSTVFSALSSVGTVVAIILSLRGK